ncbi:RusA family crossover junction endodeoxyribonuclease [Candidatus Poriferisodalis sp.]|uniref:RusA family crossover junction endodeoxyribonuclease n=1 Tax=Candidatus Poriferisodalis sp. TaxID=3101277 RepID=UPI003D09D306
MIELIVVGRPKSLQSSTRSLDGWRQSVEEAARATIPHGPVYETGPVHACFHWFCDVSAARIPDLDNVLKPTFDALQALVFADDYQLTDIRAARIDLNSLSRDRSIAADWESWPTKLVSHFVLAEKLEEFVYLQIVDPPNLLEAPWLPQH